MVARWRVGGADRAGRIRHLVQRGAMVTNRLRPLKCRSEPRGRCSSTEVVSIGFAYPRPRKTVLGRAGTLRYVIAWWNVPASGACVGGGSVPGNQFRRGRLRCAIALGSTCPWRCGSGARRRSKTPAGPGSDERRDRDVVRSAISSRVSELATTTRGIAVGSC